MLAAALKILSISSSSISDQEIVTLGVAITENDPLLTNQYVSGTIRFGDGTADLTLTPTATAIDAAVDPAVEQTGSLVALSLDENTYTGDFSLVYNSAPINSIQFDVTASQLRDLLRTAAGEITPGDTVLEVGGDFPSWQISFVSSVKAALLSVGGGNTTFAYQALAPHIYPTGNFVVTLTAFNFRSPTPDQIAVDVPLTLLPQQVAPPLNPIVIGPILPADVGYPNNEQWNFNTATDLKILASSVKMILITKIGERVMMPTYGTNVQQYLFGPNDGTSQTDVEKEIRRAITTWEPRVSIQEVQFARAERSATISLLLISLLDKQKFNLVVELEV